MNMMTKGNEYAHDERDKVRRFNEITGKVRTMVTSELEGSRSQLDTVVRLQKKAITGHEKEVAFFKEKIEGCLKRLGALNTDHPPWYRSLTDAVYHEIWGLAGIAQWFDDEYKKSSSAKVIGDRIYFMENGEMVLKPQRISENRREQLLRAFLLLSPDERPDKDSYELYMLDGTRVTVFRGKLTKKGQDVFVFRRYVIPEYSFEEQAARGTIPFEAVPLFKSMVKLGYNVAFTGAVRTAKTTFLTTWQSYERDDLEGVMVETDPEIPLHKIMPKAPNIQLIADNDDLGKVVKGLLRSDADYFIMAEARDGIALDTVLRMASKGTRRMKITFHQRDPYNFSYDVASEIVRSLGGDIHQTAVRAASSFDYIFHFIQLKNRSEKRLSGIYELRYDRESGKICTEPLCIYDPVNDDWSFKCVISPDKEKSGSEEDCEAFREFKRILEELESESSSETGGSENDRGESEMTCGDPGGEGIGDIEICADSGEDCGSVMPVSGRFERGRELINEA